MGRTKSTPSPALTMWRRLGAFRLRLLLRGSFLLLLAAAVLLPYLSLKWLKVSSYEHYVELLGARREQILDKLAAPGAQLALRNPSRLEGPYVPLKPYVLPYKAVLANSPNKLRDFVNAIGCSVRYGEKGVVCTAIDEDRSLGAPRLYVVASAITEQLVAHVPKKAGKAITRDTSLVSAAKDAHRVLLDVYANGIPFHWVVPVQRDADGDLRMAAYVAPEEGHGIEGKPVFNSAWVTQDECDKTDPAWTRCMREAVFSIVVPAKALVSAFPQGKWDSDDITVRLRVLDAAGAVVLDSNSDAAQPLFTTRGVQELLSPYESLQIIPMAGESAIHVKPVTEAASAAETVALRVINYIPVETIAQGSVEGKAVRRSVLGNTIEVTHRGSLAGVDAELAELASRVLLYSMVMVSAICIACATIEFGIVRYIARLTRRAGAMSSAIRNDEGLERFDFSDLRGRDEVGVLAGGLEDLLRLLSERMERERLRAANEKEKWRAIGHEIRSPLQSLMALHESPEGQSYRYIHRMQRAIMNLYNNAAPEQALASVELEEEWMDVAEFASSAAENAASVGMNGVTYEGPVKDVMVKGDISALEDVITHVLNNAMRYRRPGTPIHMSLQPDERSAVLSIENTGPHIPTDMLEKIFQYGVSDRIEENEEGGRGQGLYVARSYMAQMGGTILARNTEQGVAFDIRMSTGRTTR